MSKNYNVRKYKNEGQEIIDIVEFKKGSEEWWNAWLKAHRIKLKFEIHLGTYLNIKKNKTRCNLHYDRKNNIFDVSYNNKKHKIKQLEAVGIFITSDGKDIYYKKPEEKALRKDDTCYKINFDGEILEEKFKNDDEHNELIENKRLFSTFDAASQNTAKWTNGNADVKYLGTCFTELLQSAFDIGSGLCNIDNNYFVICYKNNGDSVEVYSKNIDSVDIQNENILLHKYLKLNTKRKADLLIKNNKYNIKSLAH